MQIEGNFSEAKAGQRGVFGMREFLEKSRVPANESESWDEKAEEFLSIGDGF